MVGGRRRGTPLLVFQPGSYLTRKAVADLLAGLGGSIGSSWAGEPRRRSALGGWLTCQVAGPPARGRELRSLPCGAVRPVHGLVRVPEQPFCQPPLPGAPRPRIARHRSGRGWSQPRACVAGRSAGAPVPAHESAPTSNPGWRPTESLEKHSVVVTNASRVKRV